MKDARLQHVAADHAKIRRRHFWCRFFDDARHLDDHVLPYLTGDHAIRSGVLAWNLFNADQRTMVVIEYLDHLLQDGPLASQKVVRENDGEWIVAHEPLGA